MSVWLKVLPVELASIADYIEPSREIDNQSDHEVGTMTDEQKKLYTRWIDLERSAAQYSLNAQYERDNEKRRTAFLRREELSAKSEVLQAIFWIDVKDHFQLWNRSSIGVRRGFIVVWSEREGPPQDFRDLFRFLSGR